MKKPFALFIAFVIMFASMNTNAQQVIASAGGYFENDNVSLSWTVGEPVTETFIGAEMILTQGFQQPYNFYITQLLSIPAGWSGVSLYVDPVNKGVESIFAPYEDDFIILASMTQFYYPTGNVNTIGNWNIETGYQIKASNDFDISMTGTKLSDPTLDLQMGWNLMPVLVSCGTPVSDLFSGVNGLEIAKEVAGVGVYWPEYGISTLSDVAPGKAYWVAMNNSATITYPSCTKGRIIPQHPTQPTNKSPWNDLHFTALSHPIAFPAGVLVNSGIEPGDIIGVFTPEGLCAGQTEITDIGAGTAVMAFSNDETTVEKDGFAVGEMFLFKLYSYLLDEEFELIVDFDQSLPNTNQFEIQGLSAVNAVTLLPTSVNNQEKVVSGVYPNPSDGHFNLAMSHWPGNLFIELLDSKGSILDSFTPGKKLNGSSYEFNLQNLHSGVFFLKLSDQNTIEIKKVVIH
ncbi:MAG: T9SS type A sorting domain-containing protein [Bacteroidales bacterium]|nr:T9SS type A sorting domain-containing protein [Bacteroidales bacterium]